MYIYWRASLSCRPLLCGCCLLLASLLIRGTTDCSVVYTRDRLGSFTKGSTGFSFLHLPPERPTCVAPLAENSFLCLCFVERKHLSRILRTTQIDLFCLLTADTCLLPHQKQLCILKDSTLFMSRTIVCIVLVIAQATQNTAHVQTTNKHFPPESGQRRSNG